MKRMLALATALLSLNAHAAANLFRPDPGVLTSHDQEIVAAMRRVPGVEHVSVVSIDRSLLDRPEAMAVHVGDHPSSATGAFERSGGAGHRIWSGRLDPGACQSASGEPAAAFDGSIMLAVSEEKITGRIHACHGTFFHVTTLAQGRYLLTRINEAALPQGTPDGIKDPESPLEPADMPGAPLPSPKAAGEAPDTSVVNVLYVYAPPAIRGYNGDIEGATAIYNTTMNRIHADSGAAGTHTTFKVAGILDVTHLTGGNLSLGEWRDSSTPVGRYIAQKREEWHADIVSVLDGGSPGYCGMAYVSASKSSAYNVTLWYCDVNVLTHEVGHNFGLSHDPGQGSPAYASGFKLAGQFRTVMAHDCSPSCPRMNYLSSPEKSYDGIVMGSPDRSDAVRRVRERRFTMANFYPKWSRQYALDAGMLPPNQYFRVSLCKRDGTGCPHEVVSIVGNGDLYTWPWYLATDINSQLPHDVIRAGELRGDEVEGDIRPVAGSWYRNILWLHSAQQPTYQLTIERHAFDLADHGAMHNWQAYYVQPGETVTAYLRNRKTGRILEWVAYTNPTKDPMGSDIWTGNLADAINGRHWKYLRGGERKADGSVEAVHGEGYRNRLWAPAIPGMDYKVELTFDRPQTK